VFKNYNSNHNYYSPQGNRTE